MKNLSKNISIKCWTLFISQPFKVGGGSIEVYKIKQNNIEMFMGLSNKMFHWHSYGCTDQARTISFLHIEFNNSNKVFITSKAVSSLL